MVKLIAKTPCAGLLPISYGSLQLDEVTYPVITSVAPFAGQSDAVSAAFLADMGIPFPAPNRCEINGDTHAVWAGLGIALVCGPNVPDIKNAALSDQSDGWAIVKLTGDCAVDVLARLVPIDLRLAAFPSGSTARTKLSHMTVSITRKNDDFEIMAMRSMARTLVHDLDIAMRGVDARAILRS